MTKVFYVATNSSTNNKDQGRKYVATFSKYVVTQSSELAFPGNMSMSRQKSFMSRQQQDTTDINSIMTREIIFATKVEKNYRKNVAKQ